MMPLSQIEQALLLAAYYRGNLQTDEVSTSSCDQVVTLSVFHTGDITAEDCANRFATESYLSSLYDDDGTLAVEINERYKVLIALIRKHSELIQGSGDLNTPAWPTFTACRLTDEGCRVAIEAQPLFPLKPDFPNWPDRRS